MQTSDAPGAAAVQLGPALPASAVILNKQMGLSFGKISQPCCGNTTAISA